VIIGLDPTGRAADRAAQVLAPRTPRATPSDGAVIGVVCNGLGEGQRFLELLVGELGQWVDVRDTIVVRKASVSVPPEPADWARLTGEATLALTGFGG
jgi:hypothetical protein